MAIPAHLQSLQFKSHNDVDDNDHHHCQVGWPLAMAIAPGADPIPSAGGAGGGEEREAETACRLLGLITTFSHHLQSETFCSSFSIPSSKSPMVKLEPLWCQFRFRFELVPDNCQTLLG